MRIQFYILVLMLVLMRLHVAAQDIHFSQYYSTPLTVNPSYTGNFTGDYRVGLNYRQQWASVTVPYRTFDFFGDISFNKNIFHRNYFSTGLCLVADRAGDGDLSVIKVMASGAYHFNLDGNKKNYLSLGIQAGYVQKTVDFSKFYFDNQWNDGGFDTGLPSGENYSVQNMSYPDVNAGVSYSYSGSEKISFYTGVGIYHLTRPSDSFYGDNENRLGMRPVLNAGASIRLTDEFHIYPSVIYMSQKKAHEILMGSMLSYDMSATGTSEFYAGFFARFGDALIPVVGYQIERWRALINYDINISDLSAVSHGRGAIELSIVYIGWLKKPQDKYIDLPCPRF